MKTALEVQMEIVSLQEEKYKKLIEETIYLIESQTKKNVSREIYSITLNIQKKIQHALKEKLNEAGYDYDFIEFFGGDYDILRIQL